MMTSVDMASSAVSGPPGEGAPLPPHGPGPPSSPQAAPAQAAQVRLPAVRREKHGGLAVSYRAILALSAPLFLHSGVQALLGVTDTWFISRISSDAVAAMGANYFLNIVFLLAIGGVGVGIQTLVAQAYGADRDRDAATAVWSGLWGVGLTIPVFTAVAFAGPVLLAPFSLEPEVEMLALDYWEPRMMLGSVSAALWALAGFFNGIGRTRTTLYVALAVGVLNAALNELFIVGFGMGIAGSAWATNVSLLLGVLVSLAILLGQGCRERFGTHLAWRPTCSGLRAALAIGVPTGIFIAVDLVGFAVFQLMVVDLGPVDGAASQIVMMLTSIGYWPMIGLGLAGTTLVAQAIGAGDRDWARRLGNAVIKLGLGYMAVVTFFLAVLAPRLVPHFTTGAGPHDGDIVTVAASLLWLAASYQLFDALNLISASNLRGAGDVTVPALLIVGLSWFGFLPLTDMLAFDGDHGWIDVLPHAGLGATGAWFACSLYTTALGLMLFWRWRRGTWRHIEIAG